MANEYDALKATADAYIDSVLGGHTDAIIAAHMTAVKHNISNYQLLCCFLIHLFQRVEVEETK